MAGVGPQAITAVPTREITAERQIGSDDPVASDGSDHRELSEGSEAFSSRSPSNDDLRVDTQQHSQLLVNGADPSHKRKRPLDDDGNHQGTKAEPHDVADRALVMLGDREITSPNHHLRANGISQYGPHTYGMMPGATIHRWQEPNGLPTPDTPNSNGTDRHWAPSSGPLTNGYHHQANRDKTTPPRPRKRNFSNRTRTGCKTCRKRKKKCDERKPFCGNCEKAGQDCLGYDGTKSVPREASGPTRQPVPLQAKDGPIESVNRHHYHTPDQMAGSRQQPVEERAEPQHAAYATEPVSDPPRTTRPPGYPGLPSGHGLPWPLPQQQVQSHAPSSASAHILNPHQAHLDTRGGEDSTSSPSRDMRPPTQPTSTAPPTPMTQQVHLPPPSSYAGLAPPPSHSTLSQPYYASQPPEPPSRPRHADYSQHSRVSSYEPQQAPAFSYSYRPPPPGSTPSISAPSTGSRTFSGEEVERSKMLRHHRYAHEDSTLLWDRARCEAATDKYDRLLAMGPGVREDQKRDSLLWILDPSLEAYYKPNTPLPREKGVLSINVAVKRGFRCSYGYNIKLMEGVFIDRDVTIDDAAKVEIGARSYIGEHTKIITSTPCSDLVDRKGPETERLAHDVVIESDVQIGANCTIYPGVRLAKGCTIAPGIVVDCNVESMRTYGWREQTERYHKEREQARW